ncbi:S10 family peptidase [Leekyejoonella antrihumi]|uniref:Peptidase S10 n=1 Tax=Leekyejoonella antrihumi TaxID=1660198 RepID=A0A563DRV4_9MICO|nr:peptidase S10 [Leekyejoonella antrihumi]TWP32906.1 peptidase S10 [Leekyejoonella antrihumi]
MSDETETRPRDRTAEGADTSAQTTRPAAPEDDLVPSQHTLKVGRKTLHYTATTGRVVLHEEVYADGVYQGRRAKAQVGLTAYTLDGAPTGRPVTFAFNGGPGSASCFVHLGLFGPRRVAMGDVGALTPPPYAVVDNPETLLTVSDLVLIDPVSTGYSRSVEGEKPDPYLSFKGDIDSVGEVIRYWTSENDRWGSPKLIAGESYGTTRAVGLAEHLQSRYGMYLNGLILISSVLDFGTLDFEVHRNDRAHALYLPHYAAAAHYHGKHEGRSLQDVLAEAEEYAARDYPWVLSRGNRLTADERAEAVSTVARLSGLTPDYVDRANLRIEHWRYYGELLRDQRLTVGRLDARFTGHAASAIAERMDADPAMDALVGPYATAYNHYVRTELGYRNPLPYDVSSEVAHKAWKFKEFEAKPIYVLDLLERAMRQNPHLRVHVAYGYYDGATPYFAAEDALAHLQLPDELRANIEHAYYEAGHMTYVHEASRLQQSKDLAAFVTGCAPTG